MHTNIKNPRLLIACALFAGGFCSAIGLVILTSASISPSDAEGNLFVYDPHTGEVGQLPFLRMDKEARERKEFEHEREFEEKGEDREPSEKEILHREIEEIQKHEKELVEEMREELPGSPEYEELRNELRELRLQKLSLHEQKRALQAGTVNTEKKQGKLQLIRARAEERKAILEECRLEAPQNLGVCVAQKLGKQKARAAYNDTDRYETLPPQNSGLPYGSNRPNALEPAKGIKEIMAACQALPVAERQECLKTRLIAEKNRIFEEAHRRARALEQGFDELTPEFSSPAYSPAPSAESLPRTKEEWREYNEKYNSEPTI